ncbi:LOW QUALITY PROTEIN: cathepsin G-like [Micropterus salmoides]|uniref:LOW QUALITY PROTEIN: cathepsin G-like n=1 Tax=Micropterus salmoides TaxID=27706 RepID=UPI0018EC4BFE|nr:LOW QUALITY PROTEIN: cathepsin G-like [Micropterus salmoides]
MAKIRIGRQQNHSHGHGSHGEADENHIINGKKTPENLMLFMASVQKNMGHICGGFLISEDFVVTAAHCDRQNPTNVVLGTLNLRKVDNDTMRYRVKTSKHPSYTKLASMNDIMLLKLSKKARLGKRVRPTHPRVWATDSTSKYCFTTTKLQQT